VVTICESCGQPDEAGSAYCLNVACGALLVAVADDEPSDARDAAAVVATAVGGGIGDAAADATTPARQFTVSRWVPTAAVLAAIGIAGAFAVGGRSAPTERTTAPLAAPSVPAPAYPPADPSPSADTPTPVSSRTPGTGRSPVGTVSTPPAPPVGRARPGAPTQTAGGQRTGQQPPAPAATTTAPVVDESATLSVSTSRSYCNGAMWTPNRKWMLVLDVTVSGSRGQTATASRDGGGSQSLSGDGYSYSGELGLVTAGSAVSWNVLVRLPGGTLVSRSGSVTAGCVATPL
jgi:hypothetical protein